MSFKMVCEKCGNAQEYNTGENRKTHENIDIDIDQHGYEGAIYGIEIYCKNDKCTNWVEIKY